MLTLATACAPATDVWVAPTAPAGFALGVIVQDDTVEAYVCGQDGAEDDSRWFSGPLASGAFQLSREGWELSGSVDDGSASVLLRGPDGQDVAWTPQRGGAGEGVFEHTDAGCRGGAIVWSDAGELRGAGTWCDASRLHIQVEPVDTWSVNARDQLDLWVPGEPDGRVASFVRIHPPATP